MRTLIAIVCFNIIQVTISMKESSSNKYTSRANSSIEACYNFTVGDRANGIFYSPNYPNLYPNQTDCFLTIEAPHGQYIKIEFRDRFGMEASPNCEYDRLEIRNGQHGYSDLLTTLCGHNFPQEIHSTDNYLWLRFVSDETIEYEGFKGVYTFLRQATTIPPAPVCQFNLSGESGIINGSNVDESVLNYSLKYQVPMECIWSITVQEDKKMYLNFTHYSLEKPNDCVLNYIDIYGDALLETSREERFCGTATEPFKSKSNVVHIRLHAKPGALSPAFTILFTAFREIKTTGKCDPNTEFDCDDGTCIHYKLRCDGYNNCIYRYDEEKSYCEKDMKKFTSFDSHHMIIILILFFALVIGMCASIVVSCWGKIQERRQRELEYRLRRSRESSMENDLDRSIHMTRLEADYPRGTILTQNYIKSNANQNNIIANNPEDENGCYVPEANLFYYRKQPNSSANFITDHYTPTPHRLNDHTVDCQYFQHHHQHDSDNIREGSESPIPPPPPPPALSHLRNPMQRASTLPLDVSKLDTPPPPVIDNHHQNCARHVKNLRPNTIRCSNPNLHNIQNYQNPGKRFFRPASTGQLLHVASLEDPEDSDFEESSVPSSIRNNTFLTQAVIETNSRPGSMGHNKTLKSSKYSSWERRNSQG